jgi:hypothetical protein
VGCLEPRQQAGVEQGRLPGPRLAVQQDEGRAAGVRDPVVQVGDLAAPAEEDLGVPPGERQEVLVRALWRVQRRQGRKAEERVAGRPREVPVRRSRDDRVSVQGPGQPAVVGGNSGATPM